MALADIDPFYIKAISALHSKEHLRTGDMSPLQKMVEEAIKTKSGKEKDLTPYVSACMKLQSIEDFKNLAAMEECKTASSSDNELELDLLKEDLMCVICNGMDVAARNRLLECSDCHSLYHQECHRPPVSQQDADNTWICQNCKETKKMRKSPNSLRSSPVQGSKSSKASSSSHRAGSSSQSSSYKSSSSSKSASQKPSSSSSSSSLSKSSGKPTSSSSGTPPSSTMSSSSSSTLSSSRNIVTPNINIISADKRIQSMKKKAAKLHEKRKLPR